MVLSFCMWVPGIKAKLPGLAANTFTHSDISLAKIHFFFQDSRSPRSHEQGVSGVWHSNELLAGS